MTAFFFAIFNYVSNNKWAQIALTAGIIVLVWMANNAHQRNVGARQLKARVEKAQNKANEAAREAAQSIKDETNEKVERARIASDSVPVGVMSSELPDATQSILFGDGEPA